MTAVAIVVTAIPPACLLGIAALVVRDELRARNEEREGVELAEWAQAWDDAFAAPAREPRRLA